MVPSADRVCTTLACSSLASFLERLVAATKRVAVYLTLSAKARIGWDNFDIIGRV